jgi:MFS superfamily sulfate permease-like transporter
VRTGGTPILEGLIEVGIGLFMSQSIANIMAAFPMALVGGMTLLVGIQLGKRTVELRGWKLALCLVTAGLSVAANMAVGFLAGLAMAYGVRSLKRRCALRCLCPAQKGASHD